ncbi:ISL3 family transposase [Miniimonas arenae]|uniref:ISL3 family transposase n=1 Tax=Miniimonas arenae TaxID=676201 RepID=A0A5C5B9X1_9MICO|nr:ISL3 family transposase [Miniimonas arenae]
MPDATFALPDLTKFCHLDDLGLEVVGQHLAPDHAVLACRVLDADDGSEGWCRRCGCQGAPRDTVTRRLAHVPLGWRPTTLLVSIRRYKCTDCGHVWRQDTSHAAEPRAKLTRTGLRWALEGIVVQHLTVARVAEGLGVAWNTANDAVLAEGKRVLIEDENRFDGVAVIGVDEHVWRHTRRGDKYVTVIIDLTPVRDGTGPARLLDMVEGRSKQAFKTWLAERPEAWRDAVEVVAMDGFTGFKTAAAEEVPDAVAVMDPFHVVRLAGDALDQCRRRVQLAIHGHRGFKDDPLHKSRRTLHTGAGLLTDRQIDRLNQLFADEGHVEVEATWGVYQRMIAAYRTEDRSRAREAMAQLINDLGTGVPKALVEVAKLGRTLKKRAADVLAYFDRPGTSNGPTEAICECLPGWSGTGWSGWFRSR